MSMTETRIISFLDTLKSEGKSSPSDWDRFYQFLAAKKMPNQKPPPVPFILAASGESDASKHRRLGDQLRWAAANNCLDDAIRYLEQVPIEQWNSSQAKDWERDSYPKW
jgi:hypothetical protein